MSDTQALIDDIAAEYPDLRDDHDHDHDHDGMLHHPEGEGELTDEALRQFANAAAMHYELGREGEEDKQGGEGEGEYEEPGEGNPASSLAQVVSGSIPPPPRPTYETTHRPRLDPELTLQSPAAAAAPSKRKRSEEFNATEQPIQAQGPPRTKHRLDATTTSVIDPSITNASDPTGVLSPRISDLAPGIYAARGSTIQPMVAPQSGGRGRKSSTRHAGEEMMGMTDGGGEGSDPGRKENKDERSARRAEQNRRAQQNFRKRREETMKQQETRLKELEPQLEALQRQQAETHLLLEALKLENTALRAVLVHSVKQGARILDSQGELIGTASTVGLVDPSDAREEAQEGGEETDKAVADVYAALDRLGARTHVYARTIVPSDETSAFPSSSSGTNRHPEPVLGGVAQSSMRTVPHVQHSQQQHQHATNQRTPHAFPTTNLPPFPGRADHPGQQQQVEEPTSQIDPSLEGHGGNAEDDELMMVDAETGLALPE